MMIMLMLMMLMMMVALVSQSVSDYHDESSCDDGIIILILL